MENHRNEGIQHLTPEAALTALASDPQGLREAEALRRLAEYGPNRVAAIRAAPWFSRFLRHFTHFFALILWLAAALAFVAERFQPGEGMAILGGAILGVIALNGFFSFAQEYRAEHALAALREMLPRQVQVLRSGAASEIPVESLVPGDVLLLAGGNDVPADCRLIEAFGVRVNTATVTGESIPKSRIAAAVAENDLLQAGNLLLAGTALVAGEAKAVVYATGAHTEFGRIAGLTQSTVKVSSPLQQEITRLSRWIALIATGVGVLFFVAGLGSGISVWSSLLFAIGIIVANVPEGLLPTVTLALAMGAQRMARRNALIRHLPSVETLGATTVICTDKTGTLTENRLRVVRCHADGAMQESEAANAAVDALREIAAHCHALHPEQGAAPSDWLGDPLEIALAAWATAGGQRPGSLPRIDELPFDSDRRRMSTVHPRGDGRILFCKGAAESVLPLCERVLSGGEARPLDAAGRRELHAAEEAMALHGYRVIALARRELPEEDAESDPERGLCFVGLLALEDPVRPEVPAAIEACRNAGIRVLMVTGDHPRTALAVARRIGLVGESARVIAGARLARMSAAELQLALEHRELVFARISADQKRRIVEALKRKGETVAATGDGVNDAPALREAHIGIAMGRAGTDVAKAAADMVLLDDNFASIVAAIEEGRAVFDNIRKFLAYILTSNVPEAVPYVAFVLLGIPLPLTVIQVLAVDLGTDMLPALALGAEAPHPGVMQRPPRPRHQRLVDRALALRAYAWLGVLEAAAAMCAYASVLNAGGWTFGQPLAADESLYRQATTACFGAIVLMQVANVWVCRSEREPLLGARRPPRNRLLLLGVGLELLALAAIVWTPWGNAVVGTAPLDPAAWWVVLPFAAVMLVGEELRKRRVSAARRPIAGSRPER